MSSASPQVVDYLTKQLARNPIHQSGDIVAARAKAFRLQPKQAPAAATAPPAGERQKIRHELERIRKQVFTGSIDSLLAEIERLPVAEFPDLAALARRLTVILQSRAKLPGVTGDPRFDGDFFSCLKQVLVSPPRDVAVLREQVLANFHVGRNRKRGKAMIGLLKEQLPELYALEADWLDSLMRYKAGRYIWGSRRGEPRPLVATEQQESSKWPVWVVVMLLLFGLRAAIRSNQQADTPQKQRSSYSTPNSPSQRRAAQYHELTPREKAEDHRRRMLEEQRLRSERLRNERQRSEPPIGDDPSAFAGDLPDWAAADRLRPGADSLEDAESTNRDGPFLDEHRREWLETIDDEESRQWFLDAWRDADEHRRRAQSRYRRNPALDPSFDQALPSHAAPAADQPARFE